MQLFGDIGATSPERAFFIKDFVLVAVPTEGFDLTRRCPLAGAFPFFFPAFFTDSGGLFDILQE